MLRTNFSKFYPIMGNTLNRTNDAVNDIVANGGAGGGGEVLSVNGMTGVVSLTSTDVGALPDDYAPAWDQVTGKPSEFTPTAHTQDISTINGLQPELDSKADTSMVPTTPSDIGAATAAQGAKADSAVQPAALTGLVPSTRTVAGKPLSANVTLAKGDVGLSNVDNTADASKPISTATQTALDGKATSAQGAKADTAVQPAALAGYVPTTRTVAGRPLSANITLAKADVGLGSVDNTSDESKPISTATQAALDVKVESPNSSVSGIEYYPTLGDLPATGVAGVLYFIDAS